MSRGFTSTSVVVNVVAECPAAGSKENVETKEVSGDQILGDLGCHAEDLSFLLESRVLGWSVLRSYLGPRRYFLLPHGD